MYKINRTVWTKSECEKIATFKGFLFSVRKINSYESENRLVVPPSGSLKRDNEFNFIGAMRKLCRFLSRYSLVAVYLIIYARSL